MKICILSSSDGRKGGFSAIVRLHRSLCRYGHDSVMLVANKESHESCIIEVNKFKYYLSKLLLYGNKIFCRLWGDNSEAEYYFDKLSISLHSAQELYEKIPFKPDVIIVGWVNGFVSPKILYELSCLTNAPVIWCLVDMAPLTGGCHFSWGCKKYMERCGKCLAMNSSNENDASRKNWEKKYKYIKKTNLSVVSATSWLYEQSKASSIFEGKIKAKIMLSVYDDKFQPVLKDVAIKHLGLPNGYKIIYFGATTLNDKRKGMEYLFQALDLLSVKLDIRKERILILSAGIGDGKKISARLNDDYRHVHLGYLNDDSTLALAYQASNLYVCSSVEDSGPIMINESLMCGTPVVAFEVGGAFDLVHSRITGYRAKIKSAKGLANGIEYILHLSAEEEEVMASQCREIALKYCSPKVQVDSFNQLFSEIVK